MASEFSISSMQYEKLSPRTAKIAFPENAYPRVIFIPTINGAFPATLEPKQNSKYNCINFPNEDSANQYYQALYNAHIKSSMLAQDAISAMPIPTETYDNDILRDRRIEPIAFIFMVNGKPKSRADIFIAEFDTAEKAYEYMMGIWDVHCHLQIPNLLASQANKNRRAVYSSSSVQALAPAAAIHASPSNSALPLASSQPPLALRNANTAASMPAPAVAVHASPSNPTPQSESAARQVPNTDDDIKDNNGYTLRVTAENEEAQIITEKWLNGHTGPSPFPNGSNMKTYVDGEYTYRVTTIPKKKPAPPPPPTSFSQPINRTNASSNVTERVINVIGNGLVDIEQTWPARTDAPALPNGCLETSEKQVDNHMVRISMCLQASSS